MGNQTTKSPFDVQILAARLKDLMRESVPKVTQKDLAATLGTAPNMVSAYVYARQELSVAADGGEHSAVF